MAKISNLEVTGTYLCLYNTNNNAEMFSDFMQLFNNCAPSTSQQPLLFCWGWACSRLKACLYKVTVFVSRMPSVLNWDRVGVILVQNKKIEIKVLRNVQSIQNEVKTNISLTWIDRLVRDSTACSPFVVRHMAFRAGAAGFTWRLVSFRFLSNISSASWRLRAW